MVLAGSISPIVPNVNRSVRRNGCPNLANPKTKYQWNVAVEPVRTHHVAGINSILQLILNDLGLGE
jgi:hypothetical protein